MQTYTIKDFVALPDFMTSDRYDINFFDKSFDRLNLHCMSIELPKIPSGDMSFRFVETEDRFVFNTLKNLEFVNYEIEILNKQGHLKFSITGKFIATDFGFSDLDGQNPKPLMITLRGFSKDTQYV